MIGKCETPGCAGEFAIGGRGRPRKYCDDCKGCRASRETVSVWRVDLDRVDEARAYMGLRHPVYVRRTRGKALQGRYHGLRNPWSIARAAGDRFAGESVHYITVSAALHPEKASRTIFHEMAHALQAERDEQAQETYRMTQTMLREKIGTAGELAHLAYLAMPQEIEARVCEGLHDTVGSLTGWTTVPRMARVYRRDRALQRVELARRAWDMFGEDASHDARHGRWSDVWGLLGENMTALIWLAKATTDLEQ